ncbi:MAG TPA: DNA polymerase I, partial [Dehalococcoidia bacterium]|nr:DNA polymerase I [Dehalococcoidia bacterium]
NRVVGGKRTQPLLVLLDGHGIIHRAYHAVKVPLTVRSTGEVITAVYGFANTLLSVLQELKPTHIAVALDKGKPTLRIAKDATYKAHRPEMPDDLRVQIGRCRELIEAFDIPIYELDRYEADDVLGALARQAVEQGVETYLVSLDSDIAQLVGPNVHLYMYRPYQRDSVIYDTPEDVLERYGVWPQQMPDLKGLKGDTSDNIPGVPGVGDKTAVKLIQQFGSMEGVLEHVEEVEPERLREALRSHREQAVLSKELATIDADAPVTLDLEACRVDRYDRQRVLDLFRELEFRSLVSRLPGPSVGRPVGPGQAGLPEAEQALEEEAAAPGPSVGRPVGPAEAAAAVDYRLVRTEGELETLAQRIEAQRAFAFDTETTDLDAMRARLVGLAIALGPGEAFYVPVGHRMAPDQLPLEVVLRRLGPLFEDEGIEKTAHNAKYDMVVLAGEGVWTRNVAFDTMLAAYLLGEGGGGGYRPGEGALGLKWLASKRLGIEMTPIIELIGKGSKQLCMADVEVEAAGRYAAADADMTGRLRPGLEEELRRQNLWSLFESVEMPLVPVLTRMEMVGVAVDVAVLREMSIVLGREIVVMEDEIHQQVGHRFNIGSPQQLGQVLFEQLKLPKTRKTKLGYSTDAQALEALRSLHPIIDQIQSYRELTKLKSTYVDALPALINERTGRVHTDFNQTGAATGRLSSSNPNLQNIPVRTELGGQVRRAFVARDYGPEPLLLSADYSQIELRIMAHITEDAGLVEAFMADEDIHAATASQVFGVPLGEVTPEMRRRAKVFNFGVLYGLSEFGLSTREHISREEAGDFIKTYFAKYPGIRRYIEETVQRTRELGYAETLLGRRRYFPEIRQANAVVRQAAERAAVNMPVQGTAADIIKIAMNRIDAELEARRLKSRMTLQVHDELIFECPAAELDEVRKLALDIMPRSLEMKVPLKVDTKVGKNWGEME